MIPDLSLKRPNYFVDEPPTKKIKLEGANSPSYFNLLGVPEDIFLNELVRFLDINDLLNLKSSCLKTKKYTKNILNAKRIESTKLTIRSATEALALLSECGHLITHLNFSIFVFRKKNHFIPMYKYNDLEESEVIKIIKKTNNLKSLVINKNFKVTEEIFYNLPKSIEEVEIGGCPMISINKFIHSEYYAELKNLRSIRYSSKIFSCNINYNVRTGEEIKMPVQRRLDFSSIDL